MPHGVKANEEIQKMFSNFSRTAEPLSIVNYLMVYYILYYYLIEYISVLKFFYFFNQEYDESNKMGLTNCVLKVISTGLNINNEVSKLISNEYLVSSKNGK